MLDGSHEGRYAVFDERLGEAKLSLCWNKLAVSTEPTLGVVNPCMRQFFIILLLLRVISRRRKTATAIAVGMVYNSGVGLTG